jgi:hypothetical protein
MRARLAPMLYDETDQEQTAAMRASIVATAERSEVARRKQTTGLTEDGPPMHSLQSLLADLATYARIQATTALNEKYLFTLSTRPTIVQQRALRTPRRQPGSHPVTLPALSANSREIKPLSMPKECAELQLPLPAPPSRTRRPRPDWASCHPCAAVAPKRTPDSPLGSNARS